MYRKFSRGTKENIHSDLSEINWDLALINCGDNVDAAFSKFFNSINKVINEHAPLRRYLNAKPSNFLNLLFSLPLKSIKIKNLYLRLEFMINYIAIKYLHSLDAVRSRTITHISMII